MTLKHSRTGGFSSMGESLYRHASSAIYYALNQNKVKLNVAGVLDHFAPLRRMGDGRSRSAEPTLLLGQQME